MTSMSTVTDSSALYSAARGGGKSSGGSKAGPPRAGPWSLSGIEVTTDRAQGAGPSRNICS
jgi:hypothetical protein